ncbi:B-cell receptor CD22-like [Sparus aurata]|uniref:B-cell receptor CD22-like n=1 Tax=Sparus aurata TaxID=8175 RepID=UPI0011C0FDCE|nr:B-cell receptor CD22-like [Sparus aurata]
MDQVGKKSLMWELKKYCLIFERLNSITGLVPGSVDTFPTAEFQSLLTHHETPQTIIHQPSLTQSDLPHVIVLPSSPASKVSNGIKTLVLVSSFLRASNFASGLVASSRSWFDSEDFQVKVGRSSYSGKRELKCHSSCRLPARSSYIWYKNGQKIQSQTSSTYSYHFNSVDSYSCAVKGHEDFPSPPVYAPRLPSLSVSPSAEIVEGSSVTLTCSCDANPAANYTWYKKNGDPDLHPLSKEPQLVFSSIQSSDSGEYYCTAENELGRRTSKYISINVTYAPRLPSVSVSPSAEIVEGSSVTLTCSSDANPAGHYTWYKEKQKVFQGPEGFYHFSSISSEDRGNYSCKSENQYGEINSSSLFVDVQYAPKLPSVSVSPSAEIVEGSSVTLTCSSDANPAAKYTWYKNKGDPELHPLSKDPQLVFSSIQSSDSGEYYCTAENELGRRTSEYISINVTYAPKLPSVSVSPSAEIVEGSSVTLTCSSDANPAANYTWYKKNEDSPKASGQIFTITDFRAEHSGNYSCEAQNRRGRHNSSLHLIVVAGSSTTTVMINIIRLILVVLIF